MSAFSILVVQMCVVLYKRMAIISAFLFMLFLALYAAREDTQPEGKNHLGNKKIVPVYIVDEECVSRQEFESLKYDLHYWKNVTLTNNIANEKGIESS